MSWTRTAFFYRPGKALGFSHDFEGQIWLGGLTGCSFSVSTASMGSAKGCALFFFFFLNHYYYFFFFHREPSILQHWFTYWMGMKSGWNERKVGSRNVFFYQKKQIHEKHVCHIHINNKLRFYPGRFWKGKMVKSMGAQVVLLMRRMAWGGQDGSSGSTTACASGVGNMNFTFTAMEPSSTTKGCLEESGHQYIFTHSHGRRVHPFIHPTVRSKPAVLL